VEIFAKLNFAERAKNREVPRKTNYCLTVKISYAKFKFLLTAKISSRIQLPFFFLVNFSFSFLKNATPFSRFPEKNYWKYSNRKNKFCEIRENLSTEKISSVKLFRLFQSSEIAFQS